MATTKQCRKCGQVKQSTDFGSQPKNTDGLQPYCRACDAERVRNRRQTTTRVIPDMSREEFFDNIDFRAAPVDGVDEAFHYRWIGPVHGLGTYPGRRTALQRFIQEADGRELPKSPLVLNCQDETPWCINPDHISWPDDMPRVFAEEVYELENDDSVSLGFGVYRAEKGDSVAYSLRSMESGWDKDRSPLDIAADRFLSANGFSVDGSLMTSKRRKGGSQYD